MNNSTTRSLSYLPGSVKLSPTASAVVQIAILPALFGGTGGALPLSSVPVMASRVFPESLIGNLTSTTRRQSGDHGQKIEQSLGTTESIPRDPAFRVELEARARHHLYDELDSAFEAEPVEAGYTHRAEGILTEALRRYGTLGAHWIETLFRENCAGRPAMAADLLLCAGRLLPRQSREWGLRMASLGLEHRRTEIREAAVKALENWRSPESVPLLKNYLSKERCVWLAEYARQVVDDLSG